MGRDGSETRSRILDAAEAAVLRQGFAATSVDEIQEGARVSRGTFFYHFSSKAKLAHALMSRYAEADMATMDAFLARAEALTPDPLHQVLVFLGLYIEMLEGAEDPPTGCLIASYAYESGLFDVETRTLLADNFRHWRDRVGQKLDDAMALHQTRVPVSGAELAEFLYGVIEGAFVVTRVEGDPNALANHIRHFRGYIELMFGVAGEDREAPR